MAIISQKRAPTLQGQAAMRTEERTEAIFNLCVNDTHRVTVTAGGKITGSRNIDMTQSSDHLRWNFIWNFNADASYIAA